MISRFNQRLLRHFCTQQQNQGLSFDLMRNQMLEPDVENLRKQILFRCANLGMKELDVIVGQWSKKNIPQFNLEQCNQFAQDVLCIETPNLLKYILKTEKPEIDSVYITQLQDFAHNGKKDYSTD